MSHRVSRRQFLGTSLLAAGGTMAISRSKVLGNVLGANDRVRIAVAGINGRGVSHIDEWCRLKKENVELVYLIDPDSRLFADKVKHVKEKAGNEPKTVQDVRRALEDKDLNAISIATPNHWHALMTIWACQAGKDVYVEKPMSHNIFEGRQSVAAARKYKCIVQHGTQNRSGGGYAEAVAAIKTGKLGKLLLSRGLCYKNRPSIGVEPIKDPPKELDWDLWKGPSPDQPYHENLVHYDWHWFWDYGNGDIGNQGVHQMDVARWAIDGATLPKSVICFGGRFGYEDQGQTPNTQVALFDYGPEKAPLIFEVRGLKSDKFPEGQTITIGNIFYVEAGVIVEGIFYPKGSKDPAPLPEADPKRGPGGNEFGNFIAAVKSRKQEDLNAEVLEGHYSSALCHLANASYRLGEKVPFNKKTQAFGDNKEAADALARMEEHLGKNGVPMNDTSYQLGRKLIVDAEKETVDDKEAKALLAGANHYRGEFTVPEKIA